MTLFSTVISNLVSVSAVFACLTIALVGLWRRPDRRGPRLWLTLVVVGYGVAAVPIVPYVASRAFGHVYSPIAAGAAPRDVGAIVVLGAGTQIVQGPEQQTALLDAVGAGRVLEAARLYRALDAPWIISSGGTRRRDARLSSAATMKATLVSLGVDPERILLESRSLTTRDEAALIAPMLRQLHSERFILVTNRTHMPRSVGSFRRERLEPIPAIVPDGLENAQWRELLLPNPEGLRLSHALLHELLGLGYYRARGWLS